MKPLTIEELKSFEVGDWVWLVYKNTDYRRYAQIQAIEGTRLYVWGGGLAECEMKQYSDYGKTWLAYKNKEEAESKGEIVELPCIVNRPPFWYVLSDEFVGEVILRRYDTREQAKRRLAELKGEEV